MCSRCCPTSFKFALNVALLIALSGLTTGCASWSNPVANGVPVRLLPPEMLARSRESLRTIPLSQLKRRNESTYLLDSGDVLGVYAQGVIGNEGDLVPFSFPDTADLPTSLGYPVPIRADGTLPLPFIEPLHVAGLTIEQAQEALKRALTVEKKILIEGKSQIILTVARPRTHRVTVVRKDADQQGTPPMPQFFNTQTMPAQPSRSNDGFVIDLPAVESDVFTALARTGGLPTELSADSILIYRNAADSDMGMLGEPATRIPFRIYKDQHVSLSENDIILGNNDIVVVDRRKPELYYTAGLLPNREVLLPADYDLTLLEAIARVGGPLLNGAFGSNNISGAIVGGGIGGPSPSLASVLRKLPDGRQINIRVDLNDAFRDPRENLLVMPDDLIVLQETPRESFARYLQGVFSFGAIGNLFDRGSVTGFGSLALP